MNYILQMLLRHLSVVEANMETRTLEQVQKEVDMWAKQFKTPYFSPLSQMACITEEVGEIARILNIQYGDKNKKKQECSLDLEEEIGDLFFTLVCLANSQSINLTNSYFRKLDKLYTRDNNRFERMDEQNGN